MNYKNQISKYNVDKNIDNEIINYIQKKKNNYIMKNAFLLALMFITITTTIVNADSIKEFIRNLGSKTIESNNQVVTLNDIQITNTGLDNLVIDSKDIHKSVNNVTLKDIRNISKVNVLGFSEGSYSYSYGDLNSESKVGAMYINFEVPIDCEEKCRILQGHHDKFIIGSAVIYTKNYEGDLRDIDVHNYGETTTLQEIANIKTPVIIISTHPNNNPKEDLVIDISFNYENVSYSICAYNIEQEELLQYINDHLK